MIATKGQLVRLVSRVGTRSMAAIHAGREDNHTARVTALVYLDQPEGQRGVQTDRDLGGSRWWNEEDLEAVPTTITELCGTDEAAFARHLRDHPAL